MGEEAAKVGAQVQVERAQEVAYTLVVVVVAYFCLVPVLSAFLYRVFAQRPKSMERLRPRPPLRVQLLLRVTKIQKLTMLLTR
jgi:cytochrome bd-type quinol oxidase subunit 1